MKMLKNEEVAYVEHLCKELVTELKAFHKETKDEDFYSCCGNQHRARFNRLRIELDKTLIKVKSEIYH